MYTPAQRMARYSYFPTSNNSLLVSLLLVGSIRHLAEFILLGELTGQLTQLLNEHVAGGNHRSTGSNLAIGLYAQLKVGSQRVRNLNTVSSTGHIKKTELTYPVGGENHIGVAEQTNTEQVAKGVVLLVEGKDGRRRQA